MYEIDIGVWGRNEMVGANHDPFKFSLCAFLYFINRIGNASNYIINKQSWASHCCICHFLHSHAKKPKCFYLIMFKRHMVLLFVIALLSTVRAFFFYLTSNVDKATSLIYFDTKKYYLFYVYWKHYRPPLVSCFFLLCNRTRTHQLMLQLESAL